MSKRIGSVESSFGAHQEHTRCAQYGFLTASGLWRKIGRGSSAVFDWSAMSAPLCVMVERAVAPIEFCRCDGVCGDLPGRHGLVID
jgi:hypothetical protein